MKLQWREWGSPDGIPVLLLHGHPGDANCMAVFAEALQHRCRLVAPDLRGYGASRTDQPFAMADHLQDVTELLDQLQLGPCLILGWSLGGILAMELALRDAVPGVIKRVRGLILVATAAHPVGDHPPTDLWDQVNTGIAALLNLMVPGQPWVIDTFGQRSLFRYLLHQHTPEAYRYLASSAVPAYWNTSSHARQALSQALRQGYNRLGELTQIEVPTLVMAAAHDRHITPAASHKTAQALPQADWILYPNVAHLFPWEIPSQVQQDILAWIERFRDPV